MTTSPLRSWKSNALRATLALGFTALTLILPRMTLASVVLSFGLYALVDGIVAIGSARVQAARRYAWMVVAEGLAGVGLGMGVLLWLRTAGPLLVPFVALWAVATGALELASAVRIGQALRERAVFAVGGVASILLGAGILLRPVPGSGALVALLGTYAAVFGLSMLLRIFPFRSALRRLDAGEGGDRSHAAGKA